LCARSGLLSLSCVYFILSSHSFGLSRFRRSSRCVVIVVVVTVVIIIILPLQPPPPSSLSLTLSLSLSLSHASLSLCHVWQTPSASPPRRVTSSKSAPGQPTVPPAPPYPPRATFLLRRRLVSSGRLEVGAGLDEAGLALDVSLYASSAAAPPAAPPWDKTKTPERGGKGSQVTSFYVFEFKGAWQRERRR